MTTGRSPAARTAGASSGRRLQRPSERRALALLYVALLTDTCLDLMGAEGTAVLDGSFLRDPSYAALVAALRPGRRTLVSADAYGTAVGAALLADHARRSRPAEISLASPAALSIPALDDYRRRWRELAQAGAPGPLRDKIPA